MFRSSSTAKSVLACLAFSLTTLAAHATDASVDAVLNPQILSGYGNTSFENRVLTLVNTIRSSNGLGQLQYDDVLHQAALANSKDMASKNCFSRANCNGVDLSDLLQDASIAGAKWGEGFAIGSLTPEKVVDSWMKDSAQRANILNNSFKYLGVGFWGSLYHPNQGFWTQSFCTHQGCKPPCKPPVPEPSTVLLSMLGLSSAVFVARRRRAQVD